MYRKEKGKEMLCVLGFLKGGVSPFFNILTISSVDIGIGWKIFKNNFFFEKFPENLV